MKRFIKSSNELNHNMNSEAHEKLVDIQDYIISVYEVADEDTQYILDRISLMVEEVFTLLEGDDRS